MGHEDARWLAEFEHHPAFQAKARSQEGWQPIETAPKYTAVLVSDGCSISVAERCMGEWFALAGGSTVRGPNERLVTLQPSHWMPLPARPGAGL